MRGRNAIGMVGLLFLPAIVECAPTVTEWDNAGDVSAGRPFLREKPGGPLAAIDITGLAYSPVVTVAAEFHKPPVTFADTPIPVIGTKSLPPVPGALLLVLTGFVCVSLVRDSRVWLTALTCLLWAGQTGISLLPRLALCVTGEGQRNQRLSGCVAIVRWPKYLCDRCSEIKDIYYAGLLRHLARIPYGEVPISSQVLVPSLSVPLAGGLVTRCPRDPRYEGFSAFGEGLPLVRVVHGLRPLRLAIVRWVLFEISTVSRLASGAGCAALLAKVLVRTNLARGPPSIGRICPSSLYRGLMRKTLSGLLGIGTLLS